MGEEYKAVIDLRTKELAERKTQYDELKQAIRQLKLDKADLYGTMEATRQQHQHDMQMFGQVKTEEEDLKFRVRELETDTSHERVQNSKAQISDVGTKLENLQ